MCGTAAQLDLQSEQMDAYKQAEQMTKEQYGDQQAIYGPMASQFKSIFEAGPNQEGFSAGETEDLNAQAVEGTAQNYKGAAKAVGESEAALGGGNIPMPSGAQEQQKAEVANASAREESGEESQIQQANYGQGLKDWESAAGGLETIAAGENPLGYEGAATSSGSSAATTADELAKEQNSWETAALGAAGSLGSAAIGKWG